MLLDLSTQDLTDTFAAAWGVARRHLPAASQGSLVWLRASLHDPLIVHLSFRLGNQLFFVFVHVEEGPEFEGGNRRLFLEAAAAANAHACLFPMAKPDGAPPAPETPGWGLLDAETHVPVNPAALVGAERIELSDWEVHDLAVQTVCNQLRASGARVESWHSYLGIHPSVWFEQGGQIHWVVVAGQRWPARAALRPKGSDGMAGRLPGDGHFASVVLASGDQDVTSSIPEPLYRGEPLQVSYAGLEPL